MCEYGCVPRKLDLGPVKFAFHITVIVLIVLRYIKMWKAFLANGHTEAGSRRLCPEGRDCLSSTVLLSQHLKEYLGKHFSLLSAVAPTLSSEVVLSLNPSLTTGQIGSPSCVCPFLTGGRRLSTTRKRKVVSLMSRPYFLSLQIFPILGIFYRKENHTHKLHSTQDTNKAMLSVMMLFNGIPTYPEASC